MENIETKLGMKKQENNIEEIGKIAHNLFPHIKTKIFKRVFRFGIERALNEYDYDDWKDVAKELPPHPV